jgi:hypothetical protein
MGEINEPLDEKGSQKNKTPVKYVMQSAARTKYL